MLSINKILLGINAVEGYIYKLLVDCHFLSIPSLKTNDNADVVVSLTSYGRRVKTNVVYYTLVSLLRQNKQPKQIILWLAEDEWNDDSIPTKLRKLREKGIKILFCKDYKSYKKLIPTIKEFPQSTIITVDDDVIYSKDTVRTFMNAHDEAPDEILCTVARKPIVEGGIPQNYANWDDSLIKPFANGTKGKLLFPVGVGGVLYPTGALHNDVANEGLFMKYCPNADDVWFWFCGLRNKTAKRYLVKRGKDISFDSLYQYFHKGAALTHTNNFQHQNDVQIKELFEYYGYKVADEEDITD